MVKGKRAKMVILRSGKFEKTNLFIFVDGFFTNNKDFNSQIGFIIIFGNTNSNDQEIGFRVINEILYLVLNKYYKIINNIFTNKFVK